MIVLVLLALSLRPCSKVRHLHVSCRNYFHKMSTEGGKVTICVFPFSLLQNRKARVKSGFSLKLGLFGPEGRSAKCQLIEGGSCLNRLFVSSGFSPLAKEISILNYLKRWEYSKIIFVAYQQM